MDIQADHHEKSPSRSKSKAAIFLNKSEINYHLQKLLTKEFTIYSLSSSFLTFHEHSTRVSLIFG